SEYGARRARLMRAQGFQPLRICCRLELTEKEGDMRKLSVFVALLVCGSAWAQGAGADKDKDKDKKPAETKAAPPAAAAEKPPGPAPELKKEYEPMIGNWKCTGKGTMMGKEMTSTGTYKAAWDLDNNVVVAHFEEKAKGMPGEHKGMDVYTYDPQ